MKDGGPALRECQDALSTADAARYARCVGKIIYYSVDRLDIVYVVRKLAQDLKPNYAHFTIFCPYPGTNIYAQGLANGIIKKDVWREFAKNHLQDRGDREGQHDRGAT